MPTYTDLSLTLQKHPATKDILKVADVNAVKQSLKNVLLSGPFTSPFDPIGGANIRQMLFEPITPATLPVHRRKIKLAIEQLEPRCTIDDLYLDNDSENSINIGILFHVVGNPTQQTLNFTMERVR